MSDPEKRTFPTDSGHGGREERDMRSDDMNLIQQYLILPSVPPCRCVRFLQIPVPQCEEFGKDVL
jgi:hypothetical protein